MNRRKGVIAALAMIAGVMKGQTDPKKGEVKTGVATVWAANPTLFNKTSLYLGLDSFTDQGALKVSYKGETIEISCEEIMEALRKPDGGKL